MGTELFKWIHIASALSATWYLLEIRILLS